MYSLYFKNKTLELVCLINSPYNVITLGQGHTKKTGNRNFRELLSDWVEHVELNGAVKI
jgi:hypothetical protein